MALQGFLSGSKGNVENAATAGARSSFGLEGSPFAGGRGFTAGMFPNRMSKGGGAMFSKQLKTSQAMSSASIATAKNTEMSVEALEKQLNIQDNLKDIGTKDFKIAEKTFKAEMSMNEFLRKSDLRRVRREIRFHKEIKGQQAEHQKHNIVNWKKLLFHMGILTHKKTWPLKLGLAVASGLAGLLGSLFSTAVGLGSMQILRKTIRRAGAAGAVGRAAGAGAPRAGGGLLARLFGGAAGRKAGTVAGGEAGEQLAFAFMRDQAGRQPGILSRLMGGARRGGQRLMQRFPFAVAEEDMAMRMLPKKGFGLRSMGRVAGGLTKGAGKFIPYAGAGIGLGMAAHSASKGKFADAFIHSAAGLATLIPGLGTVIAIAIDVIGELIPKTVKDTFDKYAGAALGAIWKPIEKGLKTLLGPSGFAVLMLVWGQVAPFFSDLGGILKDLWKIFKVLFVGPYSLPIIFGAITVVVAPFVAGARLFIKALKALTGFWADLISGLGEGQGFFSTLWTSFKENILGFWADIWSGFSSVVNPSTLWDYVVNPIAKLFETVGGWLDGLIPRMMEAMINKLPGWLRTPARIAWKVAGVVAAPTGAVVGAATGLISGRHARTVGKLVYGDVDPASKTFKTPISAGASMTVKNIAAMESNPNQQFAYMKKLGMMSSEIDAFRGTKDRAKAYANLEKRFPGETSTATPTIKERVGAGLKAAVAKGKAGVQAGVQKGQELGKAAVAKGKYAAGSMRDVVLAAANKYGVSSDFMLNMMQIESSGNPNAVSPTGATGLFQFTRGTGKAYGLFPNGVDMRKDPVMNAEAAARLALDNARSLESVGVPATPGMLYLAHQQGPWGAAQIFKAALTGGEVPESVRKNMDLQGLGRKSPRDFLAKFVGRFVGSGAAIVDAAKGAATATKGAVVGATGSTVDFLKNTALPTAKAGAQKIAGAMGPAMSALGDMGNSLMGATAAGFGSVESLAGKVTPAMMNSMNPEMREGFRQLRSAGAASAQAQAHLMASILGDPGAAAGVQETGNAMLGKLIGQADMQTKYLSTIANETSKAGKEVYSFVHDQTMLLFGNNGAGGDF